MQPLARPVVVPQPQQTAPQPQQVQPQAPQQAQQQTIQPLQIHIPIEVKPVVSGEPAAYPPAAPAASAPVTAAPAIPPPAVSPAVPAAPVTPAAPPPAAAPVTVILAPETAAPVVPPIQVTIKPNKIYRVQIGSFKEARNALAAFERLKEAGLNPVYERNGDFFRVVLSGIPSGEMAGVLQKLQTAGFNEPLLREER
ncbi:MAG: SPOR domain-containing protein [Treponema sp.]|nr:SPOR domain-containing protein [Treponema sp.]